MVMIPPGYPGTMPPQFPGFSPGYSSGFGGVPQPFGPTGLENVAGLGGGAGAVRGIATVGQSVLPAMAAGGLMIAGKDPFSLGLRAINPWARTLSGGALSTGSRVALGAGALGVLGAGYAAGKVLDYGMGQITTGAAREARLSTFLGSQFGFQGGQMRGMGGDEVTQVSKALYDVSNELNRSMSEVTRNLTTMKALGLTRKIRDVQEFKTTMRETMKALDTISDTFNVSMQEAGRFLEGMRGAGFRDTKSQMAMLTPLRQAQWATGMTRSQVTAHMQAGTGLARMIGATGWRGAVGAQRALVGVGAAESAGIVTEAMMEEATGLQGQEAVGAFAQISQRALAQRVSTPYGRFFLAAGAREDMRRLDTDRMRAVLGGGYSMADIKKLARGQVYGKGRKGMDQRFLMYEEEMRGQALQMGPQMLAGMVRAEMGERVYDTEDPKVNKMVRQAYGLSKRQAEAVLNMARKLPEMMAEELRQEESRLRHQTGGRGTPEGLAALKSSVSNWVRKTIDEPLQEYGAEMHRSVRSMMGELEGTLMRPFGFGGGPSRGPRFVMTRAAARVASSMTMGGFSGAAAGLKSPGESIDPVSRQLRGLVGEAGAWQQAGFLSQGEGLGALANPELAEATRKWMVSKEGFAAAMGAWGGEPEDVGAVQRVLGVRRRGIALGKAAAAAGGKLGEYFKGAASDEEYATRYAQVVRASGMAGTLSGGGLGEAGDVSRQYIEATSARTYGLLAGRMGFKSEVVRKPRMTASEYDVAEQIKEDVVRSSAAGGMALKEIVTNEAYGPILLQALSGTEEERGRAMHDLRASAQRMGGRGVALRRVLGFLDKGGEAARKDLFRVVQAELVGGAQKEFTEIVSSRMQRLKTSLKAEDILALREAGLYGSMEAIVGMGGKDVVTKFGERGQAVAGLLTKYANLDVGTRRRMQEMMGRREGGAELGLAMGYVERVARHMGKGKMDEEVKGGALQKTLQELFGTKVTADMLKGLDKLSVGETAQRFGIDEESAKMLRERAAGGLTKRELMQITAGRGSKVAAATTLGSAGLTGGAAEAIAAELGEAGKGFGTGAGMHNEMRRQSTILKEIALSTAKMAGRKEVGEKLEKITRKQKK